jgi:hypothetical protein
MPRRDEGSFHDGRTRSAARRGKGRRRVRRFSHRGPDGQPERRLSVGPTVTVRRRRVRLVTSDSALIPVTAVIERAGPARAGIQNGCVWWAIQPEWWRHRMAAANGPHSEPARACGLGLAPAGRVDRVGPSRCLQLGLEDRDRDRQHGHGVQVFVPRSVPVARVVVMTRRRATVSTRRKKNASDVNNKMNKLIESVSKTSRR